MFWSWRNKILKQSLQLGGIITTIVTFNWKETYCLPVIQTLQNKLWTLAKCFFPFLWEAKVISQGHFTLQISHITSLIFTPAGFFCRFFCETGWFFVFRPINMAKCLLPCRCEFKVFSLDVVTWHRAQVHSFWTLTSFCVELSPTSFMAAVPTVSNMLAEPFSLCSSSRTTGTYCNVQDYHNI